MANLDDVFDKVGEAELRRLIASGEYDSSHLRSHALGYLAAKDAERDSETLRIAKEANSIAREQWLQQLGVQHDMPCTQQPLQQSRRSSLAKMRSFRYSLVSPNYLIDADTQRQVAASRLVLVAGHRQRWA